MSIRSKSRLKPSPEFSMSSIADIVFLLLIFFMLTSNFVRQAGVPVDFPEVADGSTKKGKNAVTVKENGSMYWNEREIGIGMTREKKQELVSDEIEKVLTDDKEDNDVITLRADKKVFMEDGVFVINEIARHGGKVFIATEIK